MSESEKPKKTSPEHAVSKRHLMVIVVLLSALIALGFIPWSFARTTLDGRILAAIQKTTGLDISASPGVHLALLPIPRVIVADAVLTHEQTGLAVSVPRLRADIRILPLLGGHIEIDSVDLAAPQITLQGTRAAENHAGWISALTSVADKNGSAPRLVIRQGSLFLRDAISTVSTIRDMNLVVASRDGDDPLAVAGSLRWRGEYAEINMEWPLERAKKAGKEDKISRTTATATIKSANINGRFAGERQSGGNETVSGAIEIETAAFGNILATVGEAGLLSAVADKLRIAGTISWNGQELTAQNLTVILDGEKLDGALSLRPGADGRLALLGTLAGAQLDLDRMIRRAELNRYFEQDGAVKLPFDLSGSTRNIDLRLSLDNARLAQMRLSGLALQLMATPGKIDLNLVQANAYKGNIKARLALSEIQAGSPSGTITQNNFEMKLSGNFERVDMSLLSADMGDNRRLTGTGFGQWSTEGNGASVSEAFDALKGRANLLFKQGEINGIALGDMVRRAERQPLSALRDFRNGRTPFDQASLSGQISQGMLEFSDGQISGPGYKLGLGGRIMVNERRLGLSGILTGVDSGLQIPIEITGPWIEPAITLNADALIRRSGGAAPLFKIQ